MNPKVVFVKPLDLSETQAQLDALKGSNNNAFEDNTWQFETQRGRPIIIDFNDLLGIEESYPDWIVSQAGHWILIAKRTWLSLASLTPVSCYSSRLSGIKLFLAAMAHHNFTQMTRDNYSEILEFLLMHSWMEGSIRKNLAVKSYVNFSVSIQIKAWKFTLANIGLDLIAREVTESIVKKKLQNLIPALTGEGLTYSDWMMGGSYNLLTLDHGRYFVEHCLSLFEKQYPMAIALASTFRAIPELAESLGYEISTVSNPLPLILRGYSAEDLKRRWPSWSFLALQRVHERANNHYSAAYQKARYESALLQDATINKIVTACGLKPLPENLDRMRVIMWDWLRRKDEIETRRHLDECQPSVSWEVFLLQLRVEKDRCNREPSLMPSDEDYKAIGLIESELRDSSNIYHRQLVRLVAAAGLTTVVALTGWRKSEFGFPRSAIKRTKNNDKLDQYAFPWRYQVDWYVYKTSGKVRLLREVTFSIFIMAERLQSLFNVGDDQPCLYSVQKTNNDPIDSGVPVQRAVTIPWRHFVKYYAGFIQLDDWTSFQKLQKKHNNGKPLMHVEQQELKRLLMQRTEKEWVGLSIDVNLKEAWRRARDDWPRLEIFLMNSNSKKKKDWLVRYRDRTLQLDWLILLDMYIPDETKDWIQTLPHEELSFKTVTKSVMKSFIESTLYPSPHAFRHMWAEAVYRRFDGDAGWMIRSQFKHISRAMWLAYIRDKDNRKGHQRAKTQVISSLVHNYLKNKGEGYTGQLHTWMRRLFRKTEVMTPEEQVQLANHLATVEVENIKANPWGYCLLKRRTRSKAKCAETGEPMRHNASPDLCLGCAHNLMQHENVEWSLFHAASHVEALKSPIVPTVFKEPSYKLVKNVFHHVRTLNPNHEALRELQEVLESYKEERLT
ncbi:MAG: hypothetical protein RPS99_07340 [Gammaproteobacteria bacterium]